MLLGGGHGPRAHFSFGVDAALQKATGMNRIRGIAALFYPVLPSALFMIATCQADPVEIGTATFSPQRLEVGEGEAAVELPCRQRLRLR